ncbi:hypothetical protein [Methylobacterium sp. Gmos1]
MNDRETAERVSDLLSQARRLRAPGHRHTAEHFLGQVDDLQRGLALLHRDLTGAARAPEPVVRRPTRSEFPEISAVRGGFVVQFRGRPRRVAIGG